MNAPARLVGPSLPELPFRDVNQALDRAALGTVGVTFVDAREQERLLSFADLRQSARRIASALLSRGIRPGERVAIVLPTGPDFVEAFFGVLRAGAVPTPLYPPLRLARMDEYVRATGRMLRASGARLLLTESRLRLLLGRAIEEGALPLGTRTVGELRRERDEAEVQVSPNALALVQFSSGSTVEPKPVALSHRNLVAQGAALKALLPEPPELVQCGVSWLPLYHDMGLIGCLLSAVFHPGSMVLIPPELFLARPALWLRAISRHRATVSPAPNFGYGLCLRRVKDEELDGVDLSSWTYAIDGAEPISAAVLDRFARRFARRGFRREALMPVYGLSEASLAVTFSSPGNTRVVHADGRAIAEGRVTQGDRPIVSVGRPVPGAEVEIRSEDGALVGERTVGRIWTRAPFVMEGYLDRPEETRETIRDGWLDTGDLGFVDDGELFVCGRTREVVIIRGANHPPRQFEECAEELEGVRPGRVAAVGCLPPGEEHEQLVLFVETTREANAELPARIATRVAERTGIRPHTIVLLPPGALPLTSSGKLRRGETLRRHLEGRLAPAGELAVWSVAREIARSALALARLRG